MAEGQYSSDLETLRVRLTLQAEQFNQQMAQVNSQLGQLQNNTNSSSNSVGVLSSKFSKFALVAAGVVAVLTKVVKGINSCISSASKLEEVQNVVNTAFPTMSSHIDNFAQSAMNAYGLTERMAKQYSSTFGAMAQGFGFTEKQAFSMGTTLTGLAGDVASFYNISQDSAMTKLSSIFTGETESLKQLGIVMTENNLKNYAMQKGLNSNISSMDEASKVALRYQFVMDQLAMANGDFARTSSSWANQTRLLAGQFEELKTNLGSAFITALTPVIQVLSTFMSYLVTASQYVKAFFNTLFGAKDNSSSLTNSLNDGLSTGKSASSNIATNLGKGAKSAEKIKKEFKALAGIDEINNIANEASSTGSGGSGSAGIGSSGIDIPVPDINETVGAFDKIQTTIDKFISWMKENVYPIFEPLVSSLGSVWESIKVLSQNLFNTIAEVWSPMLANIKPIIEGLVLIFSGWLDVLKGIIDFVTGAFTGDLKKSWDGIKTIFDGFCKVFEGSAKSITAIVKGLFETSFNGIKAIWKGAGSFFTSCFNLIKKAFEKVPTTISSFFKSAWTKTTDIWKNSKTWFAGRWKGIKEAFSNTGSWFKSIFEGAYKNIKIAFSPITKWFSTTWSSLKKIVSDTWDGILKLFEKGGKIFSGVTDGIANVFKTIVNSLITGINKVISTPFNTINSTLNGIRNVNILGLEPFKGLWGQNPVSVPQIPKLAKGGIVDSATLAVIGEAGKEAVMPLENNTGWMKTFAGDLAPLIGGGSNNVDSSLMNRPIEIVFKMGQNTYARFTADSLNALSKQRGECVIDLAYA